MKIVLATPYYSVTAYSPYITSLIGSIRVLEKLNIEWDYYEWSGDSYVDHAKNALVDMFLKSDATHILMIDSDLAWDIMGFARLIKDALSGVEIVGGTYPNKNNWETFGTIPLLKDNTVTGIDKDGIRLIDTTGIPGGFIIYSREAFERTRNSLETYRENDQEVLQCFRCSVEGGLRVGEDIYFQRRYIENGGQVWLEPNISFYHFGVKGFPGNYHEYLLNNKTTLHIPEKKLNKKSRIS